MRWVDFFSSYLSYYNNFQVIDSKLHVDLVLDDPAGNSFVQDIYTPEKDPRLNEEEYERSFEQNDELGLNDMVTENYAQTNVT